MAEPALAGRIALALLSVVYLVGVVSLSRYFQGRVSWGAVLALTLLYSSQFLYGFVAYTAGVGLYLAALAFWLARREAGDWRAVVALNVLGGACFLAHLMSIGLLVLSVVTVCALDLARRRLTRRVLLVTAAGFVVPLLLVLNHLSYPSPESVTRWPTLTEKVIGSLAVIRTYDLRLDAVLVVLVALGLVPIVLSKSRLQAFRSEGLSIGAILLLGFVVAPIEFMSGSPVDARFILPAAAVLLVAYAPRQDGKTSKVTMAAFAIVAAARYLAIVTVWVGVQGETGAAVQLSSAMSPESRLEVVYSGPSDPDEDKRIRHLQSIGHYGTLTRLSVTGMIAVPGQNVLLYREGRPNQAPDYLLACGTGIDIPPDFELVDGTELCELHRRAAG